jgi:hydrogenase nickel incorporation protein HypA/HybF
MATAMHELSIAQSVVEIACRHAEGRKVTGVTLRVGYLRQVVPAALTFSFGLVAQGTLVEDAELTIESVPAVGWCRHCETESRLEAFPLQCQTCGAFDLQITAGEELLVASLTVDDTLDDAEQGAWNGHDTGG